MAAFAIIQGISALLCIASVQKSKSKLCTNLLHLDSYDIIINACDIP